MTREPVRMLLLNTLERSTRRGWRGRCGWSGWSGLSECASSQDQSKDRYDENPCDEHARSPLRTTLKA